MLTDAHRIGEAFRSSLVRFVAPCAMRRARPRSPVGIFSQCVARKSDAQIGENFRRARSSAAHALEEPGTAVSLSRARIDMAVVGRRTVVVASARVPLRKTRKDARTLDSGHCAEVLAAVRIGRAERRNAASGDRAVSIAALADEAAFAVGIARARVVTGATSGTACRTLVVVAATARALEAFGIRHAGVDIRRKNQGRMAGARRHDLLSKGRTAGFGPRAMFITFRARREAAWPLDAALSAGSWVVRSAAGRGVVPCPAPLRVSAAAGRDNERREHDDRRPARARVIRH
jgi:hypothetical protein